MNIFRRISSFAVAAVTASSALCIPSSGFTAVAEANPDIVDYYETDNNWAKLLQYTLFFYDANMCGTGVTDNNLLSWRGNCHVYDSKVPMQAIDD
ncbi:MAG: glycoside hydrolase family 9 protein, partial [Ruminococcus sp.]|nr:glycoside hydrolase family 9 protein [Ruminococcus sp.]